MVCDEETGIAYAGYNAELTRAFLILRYYTDLELDDTPQGRCAAYDAIASRGLWPKIMGIVEDDLADVDGIAYKLESIARAEGLNSKLIDMLGALRSSPAVRAGVPLARKGGSGPHGEG